MTAMPPPEDQHEVRLAKLARLRAAGVDPYPTRFARTHTAAALKAEFEALQGQEVAVAGRLVGGRRDMGKTAFMHLQNGSDQIQLFARANALGEESLAAFKELDAGDHVGALGTLMKTRTGEVSVELREIELLAKSLRPLPDKWHGLTDDEKRFRQRYLDLIANREVLDTFTLRSRTVQAIRAWLAARHFVEVETPVLQAIPGGGAARPFGTFYNALDRT